MRLRRLYHRPLDRAELTRIAAMLDAASMGHSQRWNRARAYDGPIHECHPATQYSMGVRVLQRSEGSRLETAAAARIYFRACVWNLRRRAALAAETSGDAVLGLKLRIRIRLLEVRIAAAVACYLIGVPVDAVRLRLDIDSIIPGTSFR